MTLPLLTRKPHREAPAQTLVGDLRLPLARVHEFCGPARRTLALIAAHATQGPVIWINSHWQGAYLHGDGVRKYIDPARITFVRPKRSEDILWAAEECLRAGCVPLVVAEVQDPPPLTPVRRLHLAAETGAKNGKVAPLGLLLTPGDGGAQGVETRWHLTPRHRADRTGWMLQRRRARMAPPAAWALDWTDDAPSLSAGI